MSDIHAENFVPVEKVTGMAVIKVNGRFLSVANPEVDLPFVTAESGDILSGKIGSDAAGKPVHGTFKVSTFGYAKITKYVPYAEAWSAPTTIEVSGMGTVGSGEDGDLTDLSTANGIYTVTAETVSEKDPFKRVYRHTSEDWYIHSHASDEYEESYWYFGTSGSAERITFYSEGERKELDSGTYTFEDYDWGYSIDVTLAVTKTEHPEIPRVLKGVKAASFDQFTWSWTWEDAESDYKMCGEEPEVDQIFAVNGNQLLFGLLYASLDAKCIFYHTFDEPKEVADSGQTFLFNKSYNSQDWRPGYTVVDRVRCAANYTSESAVDGSISVEIDEVDPDLFTDRSYVMTTYSCPQPEHLQDLDAYVNICSIASTRSRGDFDYCTGLRGQRENDSSGIYASYGGESPFSLFKLGDDRTVEWQQWVMNVTKGYIEVWLNGELIANAPNANRVDIDNKYVSACLASISGINNTYAPSFMANCRCYSGRALTGVEIAAMWERFKSDQENFVATNLPAVTDKTILAVSFNEGCIKDYSKLGHKVSNEGNWQFNINGEHLSVGCICPGKTLGEASWNFNRGPLTITPASDGLTLGESWTIEFDIKPLSNNNRYLLSFGDGVGIKLGYGFATGICIIGSDGAWHSLTDQLSTDKWYSIKIMCSAGAVSSQVDGVDTDYTVEISNYVGNATGDITLGGNGKLWGAPYAIDALLGNFVITDGVVE